MANDYSKKAIKDDEDVLCRYIRQHAQPWLKASNNLKLSFYRGVGFLDEPPLAFLRNTRTNRKPVDTSPERHKMFNAAIAAIGGIANRSNSIFVTSKLGTARTFGNPYLVIPLGEFHYTWSPIWKDWTADASTSYFHSGIREYIYVDHDLDSAAAYKHEVMIHCETALYVDVELGLVIENNI